MWFFMYICYFFSLITFGMFLSAAFQRFLGFTVLSANYATFLLFAIIIYLFTQTLIMFFFVGTGVSVKEYTHEHKLDHKFHKKSIQIKRIIYPPQLLNILLVMLMGISLGPVSTGKIPGWIHTGLLFWSMIHLIRVMSIQHQCFRENTKIILEMSGLKESEAL